jgi:hypothetical protein
MFILPEWIIYISIETHRIAQSRKQLPLMVCLIWDEPGHVERFYPNAWRMDFLDREHGKGDNR